MAEAARDNNRVPTLLAVSNADGITPVVVYADPTTHRILVSGSTTPAGSDTQVQFNDGGSMAGDAGFTYDKTSNVATIGGVLISGLTASEIVGTDASKNLASLPVATYPSLTELTYVKGVTSAIQTQINTKAPTANPTFTGTFTLPVGLTGVIRADTGVVSVDSDVTDLVSAGSESAAGKLELATDAEAVTGTDTARAVTPANLTARMAAPGAIGSTTKATSMQVDESGLVVDPTGDADADLVTVGVTDSPKVSWSESNDRFVASKDLAVPDEAYGAGWNGSVEVPTKNAVYDKIETIGAGMGYVLRQCNSADGTNNLVDSTTYYLGPMNLGNFSVTNSRGATRLYIPKAGTITAAYGAITVSGTLSSGEDSTVAIRLNDTSNTNISTTVETSATSNAFSNGSLSIAVVAGDFIDILLITPAFATEPGGVYMSCSVYIE